MADTTDPAELHSRLVEVLDDELFEITTEPIGWRCRQRNGRFAWTDPTAMPTRLLDHLVDEVFADSAGYHLRTDHPNA